MLMLSLVGEQPLPNLLPAYFLKPEAVVLIHTERTKRVSGRLAKMLSQATPLEVDPYDILEIEQAIRTEIGKSQRPATELVFNLTGGTKAMALAAYRLAEAMRAAFVYFQTEGRQSRLYQYGWNSDGQPELLQQADLPGLISIKDYVTAHTGTFQITGPSKQAGGHFEAAIASILRGVVDEVEVGVKFSGALDADLIIRSGNRIAMIEAKTGGRARSKEGIDQLNTIAGPEYFGTYTTKILIIDQEWDKTRSNLRKLAEARNITIVELPGYNTTGVIDAVEAQRLIDLVKAKL